MKHEEYCNTWYGVGQCGEPNEMRYCTCPAGNFGGVLRDPDPGDVCDYKSSTGGAYSAISGCDTNPIDQDYLVTGSFQIVVSATEPFDARLQVIETMKEFVSDYKHDPNNNVIITDIEPLL